MNKLPTRQDSGFSIIELMVVMIIVAVLAAVAAVMYNGVAKNAKKNQAASSASPSAPSDIATIVGTPEPVVTVDMETGVTSEIEPYLVAVDKILKTDSTQSNQQYRRYDVPWVVPGDGGWRAQLPAAVTQVSVETVRGSTFVRLNFADAALTCVREYPALSVGGDGITEFKCSPLQR